MEKEQKEEVREKYPNLAMRPAYLRLVRFNLSSDLSTATENQLETLIKKKLNEINKSSINPDYEVQKKEKVYLLDTDDMQNPVYEGEITIPKHLRG